MPLQYLWGPSISPSLMQCTAPNKGLELTASSVRSFVAPASGSSSGLALH